MKSMTEPLVSVLMTTYNRECFLAEAIDSVLASSYQNFELIIVDDCSRDNTVAIAKEYEAMDRRIKVHINQKNLGDYPNRNRAAEFAKGKYLKYVDSDDKLYPDGLRYCVEQMEMFADADWGSMYAHAIEAEFLLNSENAIRWHFFKHPFLKMGPGGTILKRDFFFSIGKYPVLYGPANDMYFNLKAASRGKTLLLNDGFLFYRIHEGQEQNNRFSYLYNNYRFLRDALTELELPLTEDEKTWISLKLKRRFSVNILRHLMQEQNPKKTRLAVKYAEFRFADFLKGIFHSIKAPAY